MVGSTLPCGLLVLRIFVGIGLVNVDTGFADGSEMRGPG